jgi:hypothetical protein
MIVFGGLDETSERNDTWSLAWGSPPTGVRDPGAGTANVLLPCYPNPFNPIVTIPFSLLKDEYVTLTVHDVAGRLVRRVFSGNMERGTHTVAWYGVDDAGVPVSSGVYFCRLHASNSAAVRKVVLLK